jgi:short-subunit dehydrogenase
VLSLTSAPVARYSATKAWVLNFTRGLQEEFADSSVRIQAVLPAATATEIWDLPASPLPICRKDR